MFASIVLVDEIKAMLANVPLKYDDDFLPVIFRKYLIIS